MRDVRTLRTLALLDLESHPPAAAIDRVTIVIDPTPGRVLQHRLFTRAHPTPEQLSTLVARLGALMGQDRFGAPATIDSYRPGAFAMTPFATEHDDQRRTRGTRGAISLEESAVSARSALNVVSAVRRCRQPVPARVVVADGRPVRVTTDRRGFAGGSVVSCAGPWRTSGEWWKSDAQKSEVRSQKSDRTSDLRLRTSDFVLQTSDVPWDRDEWDVALSDGAIYRLFRNRDTDGWLEHRDDDRRTAAARSRSGNGHHPPCAGARAGRQTELEAARQVFFNRRSREPHRQHDQMDRRDHEPDRVRHGERVARADEPDGRRRARSCWNGSTRTPPPRAKRSTRATPTTSCRGR